MSGLPLTDAPETSQVAAIAMPDSASGSTQHKLMVSLSVRCWLQEAGSSEYETDSEEEYGRQMLKPVFVPKSNREVSFVNVAS